MTHADDPAPHGTRKPPPAAGCGTPHPISVLLIEDNRLLREGLAALVRKQPGFHLLGAATRLDSALLAPPAVQPDILLLDAALREHDSLGAVRTVHLASPHTSVIVMGLLPAQEDIVEFVRAGVSGFILKDATFEQFVRSILAVANGEHVLPRTTTRPLFSQIATEAAAHGETRALAALRMTPREREIVTLISDGLTNKEIAQRFHISRSTVKSHVHNILEKLAFHTRVQIATYASRPSSLNPQD